MSAGSVYRASGRARAEVRELAFFHARFTLIAVVALAMVVMAASCTTTPRTVSLRCTPEATPALQCRARVRSFWGEVDAPATVVEPSAGRAPLPWVPLRKDPPPSLADLHLDIEYQSRGKGESWSRLVAGFGREPSIPLTDLYPTRFGGALLTDMFRMADELRAGRAATLAHTTGWGGLLVSLPLCVVAVLLTWLASGRSRVTFAPESGRVEVATQSHWLRRWWRRELAVGDIVDARVTPRAGVERGPLYRPALALRGGELVVLGEAGLRTPERAEHFAAELRRLLELGDEARDGRAR
ncbi:MAG: hypothetical protein WKG00_07815 [Polyangiaceae bacterium]